MSAFQLGPKVLIINSTDEAKILFYAKLASGSTRLVETDDDFQTTTPYDDLSTSPDTQSGAEGSSYSPASVATADAVAQADLLRILGFGDFDASSVIEARGSKG